MKDLIRILESLIDKTRITVIGGDFNVSSSKAHNNIVTSTLKDRWFSQIVKTATQIEGGVLDHVYINTNEDEISWEIEKFPKYYSDHDGIGLTLWNGKPNKGK